MYEKCILPFGCIRFFMLKLRDYFYDLLKDLLLLECYFTLNNAEIVHVNCLYLTSLTDMYYSYISSLMLC